MTYNAVTNYEPISVIRSRLHFLAPVPRQKVHLFSSCSVGYGGRRERRGQRRQSGPQWENVLYLSVPSENKTIRAPYAFPLLSRAAHKQNIALPSQLRTCFQLDGREQFQSFKPNTQQPSQAISPVASSSSRNELPTLRLCCCVMIRLESRLLVKLNTCFSEASCGRREKPAGSPSVALLPLPSRLCCADHSNT